MTTAIVTVGQDMRVEDVAKLILDRWSSDAPVVDVYQNVISIVSEIENHLGYVAPYLRAD
jgi:Mg/Co/Ni transporter MgtE